MNVIMNAISQISQLHPEAPPAVATPPAPNLIPAQLLAGITGGSSAKLEAAAQSLAADKDQLNAIIQQAQTLCQACIGDLIKIGIDVLMRAIPAALGLLIPNPAAQAAATAALTAIAVEGIGRAVARVQQLISQLAPLAQPLLMIAARAITSAVSEQGRAARHALEAEHPGMEHHTCPLTTTPAAVTPAVVAPAAAPAAAPAPVTPPPAHPVPAPTAAPVPPPAPLPGPPPAPAPGPAPAPVPVPGGSSGSSANPAGIAAVNAARSMIGQPYVWGGTGENGFDCSGLTQWAYRQAGVELPRLAQEQNIGKQIKPDELQAGDLAVWDGHVAMYSGNGTLIEAGSPVQENPLRTRNMGMAFKGFWRPTG